ncbi:IrrE N-terminal-like domain-containing protein [Gammaproteobacteria bacterium]
MMSEPKNPVEEANGVSDWLDQTLGLDRFPVDVESLALEYSQQHDPESPITRIVGEDLPGFEGMLKSNKTKSKWLIIYNSGVSSRGRRRFTVGHEFGHYKLHRERLSEFTCSHQFMGDWDDDYRGMEKEADAFSATLLMPHKDFQRQMTGQAISFDLMHHCVDRYDVSTTAAALTWVDLAENRAVLVATKNDRLVWAYSNQAAFKSGAYFATRKQKVEIPQEALIHRHNQKASRQIRSSQARIWFPKEPDGMPLTEMSWVADQDNFALTLLLMPEAERPASLVA